MRLRSYLVTAIVFVFALPAVAADEVDAGGCPIGESWAVPAEVLTVPGPAATTVPLIPDDSMLECDVAVECGVHFQEVLPLPAELGVVAIDTLRFRVDESTPLSTTDNINCWSVEVSLAVYPFEIDDVSPVFELNSTEPPDLVYQGPICLDVAADPAGPGLGEELVVPLEVPWVYDATAGNLLVDVTVDGVAGYSGDVLLDAVDDVVTVVSLEGPDAPAGDVFIGGPVIIVDGIEGPAQPGDPRDCLANLDIPDNVRDRLEGMLDSAESAADSGLPGVAERLMGQYHHLVDRYEGSGAISEDAADKAHEYGSRIGGVFMGPYMLADAVHELAEIRPVLTIFGLEGLIANSVPEDDRAWDLLEDMDGLWDQIFFDNTLDASDLEEVRGWRSTFRRFISNVWRDVTIETRGLFREAWRLINDFWRRYQNDPEFRFLVDLWRIAGDGTITQDEAGSLKDLRKQLTELLEGADEGSPLAKALKKLPYILHQLAVKLEKGEITGISVSYHPDVGIGIFINTSEPVWIKVFEYDVPDNADIAAGETLTILVRVSNAGLVWTPTENGHVIEVKEVEGDSGMSANINVTDLLTVWGMELDTGIDLDDLRINKVTLTGGRGEQAVIEATSDDGESVRIVVENGTVKSVEVDGVQTYPD